VQQPGLPVQRAEEGLTMRYCCYFCGKSVSNEVPDETVIRALLVCPECIDAGRIAIAGEPVGSRRLRPTVKE
jgi:DNA-directed RNA polymerase subunit RPC12/RpoP